MSRLLVALFKPIKVSAFTPALTIGNRNGFETSIGSTNCAFVSMPVTTADTFTSAKDPDHYDIEHSHHDHGIGEAGPSRALGIDQTRDITEAEHELGFWQAIGMYPQATFWSMFFCIAVVMAGFDAQIITSFYALPAFQRKYGDWVGDHYEIAAPWQTGLGMGNPIGQAVGALASSYPLHYLGRRKTLGLCCVWSVGFVFVQFFATSIGMLCVGEVLGGLAYGFYVVIAPTYASEICPVTLRGFLTTSVNLAFVIGQFIAQGCAAGVETRLDEWAYKIPFVSWRTRPHISASSDIADQVLAVSCHRPSNGYGLLCCLLGFPLPRKVHTGLSAAGEGRMLARRCSNSRLAQIVRILTSFWWE